MLRTSLLFILSTSPALAQELSGDRPDFTEGTAWLGAGVVKLFAD